MSLPQTLFRLVFPKAPAPAVAPTLRDDSWINTSLGYGGGLDKTSGGYFTASCRLGDGELSSLYYGDSIAALIVDRKSVV